MKTQSRNTCNHQKDHEIELNENVSWNFSCTNCNPGEYIYFWDCESKKFELGEVFQGKLMKNYRVVFRFFFFYF